MLRIARRCGLLLALGLLGEPSLYAQTPWFNDRDLPRIESRPPTRDEYRHSEALTLYAVGLLHERGNRLVQAVTTFEDAAKLEPEAPAIHKALIPLYLALDRGDDALAACQRVVELAPGDAETWHLYARQLKALGRSKDCLEALAKGAACPCLKEIPELHLQMCFDLGMIAESLKDDTRALQAFQQVADLLENSAALADEGVASVEDIDSQACDVYERMAKICLRGKKFDQAVAFFGKAQKKAGEKQAGRSNYINYSLAQVLAAKEDYAGALKPLDEYLRSGPSDLEPYKFKIDLLTKLKRRPEIAPFLEACCQADKNNASLKLLLAEEYGKENRTDDARKVYEKMAEDMPRDGRARPEVYRGLFHIWKSEGSKGYEKILDALNASFPKEEEPSLQAQAMLGALRDDGELVGALLPVSIARLRQRDGLKPQTRFFLAVLAGRTKHLDNAEKLYRSCLDDLLRGVPGNEPEVFRGLLRVLWEQHKYEGVVEVCRVGLDKSKITNRVVFQVDLARASVLLGKNKEAAAAANDAVDTAREEDRMFCRRIRAEILAQAGQYEPAVADCLAMLKEATKASETHEIRLTLSNVYTLAKEMDKAEDQLERALKDDPDDATACNDLGYLWADRNKNLAEAERLIRKALELDRKQKANGTLVSVDADQDNAAYVDSLGWVLFRRGKLKEARAQLERATTLEHGADDPVVWDHLGDVYMRSREPAKAKESWKKAVALYETAHRRPKDDRYKEIQQKLKVADQQTLGH